MAREATRAQRETTSEQWAQIREILANALELDPNGRTAYLETTCSGDPDLRARIDELIAAHDATGASGLELPAFSLTSSEPCTVPALSSQIGRRIGAYRIEAEIAHGGMGTVFRAVRADDEFKKQVAIKLVPGAGFSSYAAELFRRERQVLATLEHPNIARLLDGGTTEDGAPFLVMEYVEGQPVTEYCKTHQLSLEERLKIFQKICSAVQYAHQNLVIHRDIKPANILVTEAGEPKLLDFGIAKIIYLDERPSATVTAWQALTPAYASPEQFSGGAATTATDIYSLGVVLYEVLTGISAFPVELSGLQRQRAVLEQEPEAPSKVVLSSGIPNSERVAAELKGDLDSIIAKAMRKVPSERYASALQLSEDIRRHCVKLPVIAHRDTTLYRMMKFARRHRAGIAAAALVLMLLLAGIIVTTYEARVAQAQRQRAERRFNDVRKLANALLFDVHDSIQDLPGSTPARRLIVEKSLQYLDSLSAESGDDRALLRELATAYERVGELQGHYLADNLGENSNSLASYQKALKIRQQLGEGKNAENQDRLSLAESYRRTASQMIAMGNTAQALSAIHSAVAISDSLAKSTPDDLKVLYELGFDYEVLGNMQGYQYFAGVHDLPGARDSYGKAITVDNHMLHLDANSLPAQRSLAMDLLQMGNVENDLGRNVASIDSRRQALEMFISIAERTKTIKDRRRIAVAYNQIADNYDGIGEFRLSLENHRKALELYKELIREDPKNALLRQGLAIAYGNTGDDESKLGRLNQGRADISEAIAGMAPLTEGDANSQQRGILAQMHMLFADNFAHSGSFSNAVQEYQNALHLFEEMPLPGTELGRALCKVGIGDGELHAGNLSVADADFKQALELAKPQLASKEHDPVLAVARAYRGLGDVESAMAVHSSAASRDHWLNAGKFYQQSLDAIEQLPESPARNYDFSRAALLRSLRTAEARSPKTRLPP